MKSFNYKTIIFTSFFLIIFISCSKDQENEEVAEEQTEEKEISVKIELPNNSKLNVNSLKVSTILTDEAIVSNSSSQVKIFDTSAMELTFATNEQDKIILLSYFDPMDSAVKLNSETTAVSLIMMHPWTTDLSVEAKKEAINYIKSMPDFYNFKSTIESNIIAGNLDPLASEVVINKLIQLQNNIFNKFIKDKDPLSFSVDNSKITLENKLGSISYGVGLYDSNDKLIGTVQELVGLEKLYYTLNQFKNNSATNNNLQTLKINTPTTDGNYHIVAKSGRSFDGSPESNNALMNNSFTLFNNTLGIISSGTAKILKNKACYYSIGEYVYNGTYGSINIANSLKDFSNGNKSGYLLTKDVIYFMYGKSDAISSLLKNCAEKELKSGFLKKIFEFFNVITKLESAFNTTAFLTDWIIYDKSIEFCFQKKSNEITDCNSIIGNWKWKSFTTFGNPVPQDNCEIDDIYKYSTDGILKIDEGPLKCSPDAPQIESGTYSINSSNDKIIIQLGGESEAYFIRRLDETTLELESEDTSKGEYVIFTRTN